MYLRLIRAESAQYVVRSVEETLSKTVEYEWLGQFSGELWARIKEAQGEGDKFGQFRLKQHLGIVVDYLRHGSNIRKSLRTIREGFVLKKVKTEPVDKLAGYKPTPKTAKKKATKEVGEPKEEEIITSPKLQREEQPLRKQKVTEQTLDKGKTDAELQPATITTIAFPDETEPVAREECISTFITTKSGLEEGAVRAVQSGVTLENVGGEQSIPEQEEIEDLLLREKGEEDTRDAETIQKVDGQRTMVETYLKRVTKAMRVDAYHLVLQCQAYQDQEMVELRSQLNVKEANLLDLKNQLDAMNANKEQEILELKHQLDAVKLEKQQEVHARELLGAKVDSLQRNVYNDEEKQDQWRKQYHQDLQQNNAKLQEELKLSHEGTTTACKEVYKRDKLVKTAIMEKGTEVTRRKDAELEAISSRTEV
ncbi:unnamed protein product [Calypogeia fissa]